MEPCALGDLIWGLAGPERQPGCDPRCQDTNGCKAMLTYSLRTNSAVHPRFDNSARFDRDVAFIPQTALRSTDRYSRSGEDGEQSRRFRPRPLSDLRSGEVIDQAVRIFPSDAVTRRSLAWDGMAIEVVH